MATSNQTLFTQLLIREILSHFEQIATDPQYSSAHRDGFFAASRVIRRNAPKYVAEAWRQMDWQTSVQAHRDATDAR